MNIEAAELYQRCPRLRFLSCHLLGSGIERVKMSERDALVPHVLAGIQQLLQGEDVEYAATHAYADYLKATAPRGLETDEDQHETMLEQAVLVERIVRGFALTGAGPCDRFLVVDAVTPERIFLDTHAMQTLEISQHGKDAIGFQYIVVGDQHNTPFLRGWQHPVSRQFSPAFEYRDSRTGALKRVGPEWKEVPVWKMDTPTSAEWVKFLHDKGTLSKLFPSRVVQAPSVEEILEWQGAVALQEMDIEKWLPLHDVIGWFPKFHHSCSGCEFQTACFDPKFDLSNPLAGGNFRKKVL